MKLRYWLIRKFFKLLGVISGPVMIHVRGEWLFIDGYGALWRVTYTHDPHMPLTITLQVR